MQSQKLDEYKSKVLDVQYLMGYSKSGRFSIVLKIQEGIKNINVLHFDGAMKCQNLISQFSTPYNSLSESMISFQLANQDSVRLIKIDDNFRVYGTEKTPRESVDIIYSINFRPLVKKDTLHCL